MTGSVRILRQALKEGTKRDLLTKGVKNDKFKKEELGPKSYSIPESWKIVDLDSVCTKITDGTHDTPNTFVDNCKDDKLIPFVTSVNIKNGFVDLESAKYIGREDHEKIIQRSNPEFGDILFTHIGASVGNVARVETNDEFSIKNVALFKPSGAVDSEYLEYALQGSIFQDYLTRIIQGVAQPFLGIGTLEKLKIPLPQKAEQKEIAKILSKLDDNLENEKRRKEVLNELKNGLMQDLLTGEIRVNTDD